MRKVNLYPVIEEGVKRLQAVKKAKRGQNKIQFEITNNAWNAYCDSVRATFDEQYVEYIHEEIYQDVRKGL